MESVPSLLPIDVDDFDRLVMVQLGAQNRSAAIQLAHWLCAGLAATEKESRHGVAYVQLDEALGVDAAAFRNNVFVPSEPIVACITGTRALVNAMGVKSFVIAGARATGCRGFLHRFKSLSTWVVVQGENIIMPEEGYFEGTEFLLRKAGWAVWTLEPSTFQFFFGAPAADNLAHVPSAIPPSPITMGFRTEKSNPGSKKKKKTPTSASSVKAKGKESALDKLKAKKRR